MDARSWGSRAAILLGTVALLNALPAAWAAAPRGEAPTIAGGEWPFYGADLSNTRTSIGGPAKAGVPTLVSRWRFDAQDGDFTGTPVVSGGRVFVGSNGPNGPTSTQSLVRALDASTGKLVWQTKVGGPVNGSVAVAGGRVFVPVARLGQPFIAALSATTGSPLWQTTVDTQHDSDIYSSPIVANGVVYQGVSALFSELHDAKPIVRGGLVAIDGGTGRVRWHTFTVPPGDTGGGVWSTPAVDLSAGVIYVGTGNAYQPPAAPTTDSMLKVRASDGAIVAHFQATPNDVWNATTTPLGVDYDFGASANLITARDGTRVIGQGQKSGVYWALRRSDMKPLWTQRLGPGSAVGGILGSTAYDGRRIYGPMTAPGYVWALNPSTGTPAWLSPVGDPLHWSPLSVSNGVAYSADSAGFLDAWDAGTGVPLARIPMALPAGESSSAPTISPAFGGVALAGGTVFADTGTQGTTGAVVALRPVA
jgi:polyvinyl alcohol dehydrogenase (cytochrome)